MREINFYAIDPKQKPRPFPVPIQIKDARELNDRGSDIYWTFNEFAGFGRRTKRDLKKIWVMYCEVDGMLEDEISKKIQNNLAPSLIIKSFNGFHMYWYLREPIDCSENPEKWADWFHDFVKTRMLHVFNADPQACDACRLLRAPFYRYWKMQKDGSFPDGSFHSDIVLDNEDNTFTIAELERGFPLPKRPAESRATTPRPRPTSPAEVGAKGFWAAANALPNRESLDLLSGSLHVNGERFTFKKEKTSTRIMVNGRASNAWLDKNGLIGSTAEAGPAIPNWLYFYHRDWKRVAEILKEVFPELRGAV